jgi:hypothetical protein
MADDVQKLKEYFGMCAYVAEALHKHNERTSTVDCIPDPALLPRICPPTEPLSPADIQRLANYKTDTATFRDG